MKRRWHLSPEGPSPFDRAYRGAAGSFFGVHESETLLKVCLHLCHLFRFQSPPIYYGLALFPASYTVLWPKGHRLR